MEYHFTNLILRDVLFFKQEKQFRQSSNEKPYNEIKSDAIISKKSIESIYIYSDIVENQYVGDYKVPLLRVVPVRSNFGEMDWIHYDKPHYMRMNRENINNIDINIRGSTGEFVSFVSGKVIVTLVFRRISSRFYQ